MSFWQDVSYAIRTLRRSPGPTAAAVIALALGMGANTAMFSVVDAVLLNSAALRGLRDPGRLVMVWERNPAMMVFLAERLPVALQNYREWKRQNRSFAGMTRFLSSNCTLGGRNRSAGDRPERVESMVVEPGFFALLGIRTEMGRAFTAGDAQTAKDRVVMVSEELYRKRFGGDPNLAGKTLQVDGVERAVVGVLPEKFEMPGLWQGTDQRRPAVWMPADAAAGTPQELWSRTWLVYARLRPGVTVAQARSEMKVIGEGVRKQYPEQNEGCGVNVFSLAEEDVGPDLRHSLLILQVAVGFVLLIACANVANLLLARAVGREREIAIRLALGAWRGRIVRLMLTESVLLSLLGAAVGVGLAFWSLDAISALAPQDTHGFHELRLDGTVLGFTLLMSVLTGVIFGLAPAWHAAGRNLNEALSSGGRSISSGPQWLRSGMVVGEVALALILLAGAGLMIRSLSVLMSVDPGFRTDHLLTVQTASGSAAAARSFGNELLARVERLPGVQSASISSGLPMESVTEQNYSIEGRPKPKNAPIAGRTSVTETFFRTMGVPIRRGRGFTRADAEANEPAVLMVNDAFVRRNWPAEDPLGKVVLLPNGDQDLRLTVVGVVGNLHEMGPDAETRPELYVPSRTFSDINLAVRTAGDPMALGPAVERAVWSIDPTIPVQEMRSMQQVLHDWPADRRFNMMVLGGFAGLALLLSSLGLYGVLAYLVTLRTRELGIRVALGAGSSQVLRLVVGQGLRMTALGIGIGLAGALLLTRLMQSLVFGISTSDPVTFAAVVVTLALVALLASYVPARRATKVDPMQALRTE
jgi:putative ABC transport system permease protein